MLERGARGRVIRVRLLRTSHRPIKEKKDLVRNASKDARIRRTGRFEQKRTDEHAYAAKSPGAGVGSSRRLA